MRLLRHVKKVGGFLLVAAVTLFGIRDEGHAGHPIVVGFERFFTTNNVELADGGELLLSELRCVNCHDPGQHAGRIPVLAGPRLADLQGRLHFDHLTEWLMRPQTMKPGTLMPHLLADSESDKDALALVSYLFSNGSSLRQEKANGSPELGKELFHSVGCVACHAPDKTFHPASISEENQRREVELPSVPLGDLRRKYTSTGMVEFLMDPLRWHPDGRMPRIPLNREEAADLAAYLTSGQERHDTFRFREDLVELGRKRFAELRCAACHSIPDQEPSFAAGRALSKLPAEPRGCLSDLPGQGLPNYQLSPLQRRAILAALQRLRNAAPLTAAEQVHRRLLGLNCYACHQRDGLGGPEAGRALFFQTTGDDLEDEGRFPPGLQGVGRKLLPDALKKVLRGEYPVRAYMSTRMPDFGDHNAAALTEALVAADLTGDIVPTPRDNNPNLVGRSPWGRELIGINGLGCINCHDLGGNKSLGIRAVDLMHAPKRLWPEWFRDYLIDPAAFKPGTRMPSFWPEGKAIHSFLGRNTTRQIDSLWVYLTELDQNRLPEGMEAKDNFELKPHDAPIVFRTFMESAGLHAIAVGFPEGVHVAFDAEEVRWSLAWRGRFLDAEGTWDDRFAPLAKPLGTNVMTWPAGTEVGGERIFKGYRIDPRGVPTFLYHTDLGEVEDTIEPEAGQLRRTVQLRGEKPFKWFPLLTQHHERKIETRGTNTWNTGDLAVRLLHPSVTNSTIMQLNGTRILMVELPPGTGAETTIITEVSW